MAAPIWKAITCNISELRLDRTLACGQSFRWKEQEAGTWTGVIGDAVWNLRQTESSLLYQVYRSGSSTEMKSKSYNSIQTQDMPVNCKRRKCRQAENSTKTLKKGRMLKEQDKEIGIKDEIIIKEEVVNETHMELNNFAASVPHDEIVYTHDDLKNFTASDTDDDSILINYFQLHINLKDLYKNWSNADANFGKVSKHLAGIRMLRQDPVECLFSFICSSNNNISRISSMVDKLALHYGTKIISLDGQDYFTFPNVEALAADGVEEKLRSLGFGYRAKYIQKSACYIQENGGDSWLTALRYVNYTEAKAQLMQLYGVGAKVADCVSLMCLDKTGAIPVDTHVWQIAARDYMPHLRQAKTLTDKLYNEIGEFFRSLWGPFAGWAQSVLFAADLKKFKDDEK